MGFGSSDASSRSPYRPATRGWRRFQLGQPDRIVRLLLSDSPRQLPTPEFTGGKGTNDERTRARMRSIWIDRLHPPCNGKGMGSE